MATAYLIEAPYSTAQDNNGTPISGAQIYTYAAGTSTPQVTYTDATGSVNASNPIVADSAGRYVIWANVPLKVTVADATQPVGIPIRTTDNITPTGIVGANSVSNANLAQAPALTVKGNPTGATANETDMTQTQLTTLVNTMVGDTGSGGTKGLVPAPSAGDAAANKVLGAGGTWVQSGSTSLISTTTLTGASANYVISAGFDSTKYYGYRFEILDYRPATTNTQLGFQVSINAGSSYVASSSASGYSSNGSAVSVINTVDVLGVGGFTSTAGFGNWAHIDIYQNGITTDNPIIDVKGANSTNGTGLTQYQYSEIGNAVGNVINAIKFTPSSGNITSGVIKMYGFAR